jgi:hypothetical protein
VAAEVRDGLAAVAVAERVATERVADDVLVAVAVAELVRGGVEVATLDEVALATADTVALAV